MSAITSKARSRWHVEHARVDRGRLLAGAGVELGAHRVEDLVDLQRAVALGAAEQHVLEQVRRARPRARPRRREPVPIQKPERHRAHGGHALGDDPHARVERRQAVRSVATGLRLGVGTGSRASPLGRAAAAVARAAGAALRRRGRRGRRRCGRGAGRGRRRRRRRRRRRPRAPRRTCRRSSGSSARRRPMRPRSRSTSTTRTWISSPLLRTSSTVSTRWPGETLEMCSRPSVPLASSTNAPNVVVLTTLPRELVADLDLLRHRADPLGERLAELAVGRVDQHLALVVDVDLGLELLGEAADRLAALADQQADLDGSIWIVMMRGAYGRELRARRVDRPRPSGRGCPCGPRGPGRARRAGCRT